MGIQVSSVIFVVNGKVLEGRGWWWDTGITRISSITYSYYHLLDMLVCLSITHSTK